jgi:hypothetical protein
MKLNEYNISLAYELVTGKDKEFVKRDSDYQNLMLSYLNDDNSSSLREAITCYVCGYVWNTKKHGVDAIDYKTKKPIECKPKIHKKTEKSKYCTGGGCFNDMTLKRVEKYLELNVQMLCSIFSNNRLIYVVEFPFSEISQIIKDKMVNRKEESRSSPSFSYTNYMHLDNLKVHYFDLKSINKYECLSKQHLKLLLERIHGKTDLLQFFK